MDGGNVKRYKGGCAIMLRISEEPEGRLFGIVSRSKFASPPWKLTAPDYHLTLQFVGRDLAEDKIGATIYSAFLFTRDPFTAPIEFTGAFGILSTRKGNYLVAHVNGKPLEEARKKLDGLLLEMGVVPKDSFDFNPHVTLAEAPPDAERPEILPDIKPFSVEVKQMVVKYGPYKMIVEL